MKSASLLAIKFLFLFICAGFIFFSCTKNTSLRTVGNNPPDATVFKDVQYGSNKDMNGITVNLALDVYVPNGATASQKFPFILFVHGGGFTAGDKSSAATAMQQFTSEGYVAASIDYRLDSSIDAATDPCSIDTGITQRAVYMSVQDARAAMRFMVANASKYNIDTSKIFLDGNSAGAVTILNSYYLTQTDFNKIIPGIEAELGGINNADNSLTNTFHIIGMAANSGCLPNPEYITSSNAVPTILFHGGEDSVIPVQQGHAYYCPSTMYVYGSKILYARFLQLGVAAVIHIDPTGGHGPYTEDFLTKNEICFFKSVLSKKTESGSYSGQQSSCN
ncbi:MAG: alpha/beta hydrolase [Parafilimonas sp.]